MLDKISLSKNAQFFIKKKKLSNVFLEKTFKDLSSERIGNYLIKIINQQTKINNTFRASYSILSFKINSEPSFLKETKIIKPTL